MNSKRLFFILLTVAVSLIFGGIYALNYNAKHVPYCYWHYEGTSFPGGAIAYKRVMICPERK